MHKYIHFSLSCSHHLVALEISQATIRVYCFMPIFYDMGAGHIGESAEKMKLRVKSLM